MSWQELEKAGDTEKRIIYEWMRKYIEISIGNSSEKDKSNILKHCSSTHFDALQMETILKRYTGNLTAFIQFLETEWGWKVEYEEDKGIITADENKAYCVCPLVKYGMTESEELCTCSEGFAETIFSLITEKQVSAKVIRSFLRDQKSCVYRITIPR